MFSLTKIQHPESIDNIKDQAKWERFDFDKLPPLYQLGNHFVVMSDSTILVTGAPAKDMCHLFTVVNYRNQTVAPLASWPNDAARHPDRITEKLQAYTSDCGLLWNGKDRFLYWNGFAPLAFVFTIDGIKMNILNNIYSCVMPPEDTTPQCVNCCTNSNLVYSLYRDSDDKGARLEKYTEKFPSPMGNTVEVFDWDGVKQKVIHLDKLGREIMLSKDGRTLYLYSGFMHDEDEYMYSYDLSSIE